MPDYPLYHITALSNLGQILATGAILCKNEIEAGSLLTTSVAHADIQARRKDFRVPTDPGGVLHDYVPLYFCPRSPMLYAIHSGAVATCSVAQSEVLHLVTSVEAVMELGCQALFTDGHAAMGISHFFRDPGELGERLDHEVIGSWSWGNRENDPDRKRRKQAEALVHRALPWSAIREIGAHNPEVVERVSKLIRGAPHRPRVSLQKAWYY